MTRRIFSWTIRHLPTGRHSAGRQRLYRRRKDRALGRLPVLAGYDLGTYQTTVLGTTVTGSGAELVNGLFLGRRAFYEEPKNEKAALAREGAQRLWEILTEGATP